MRVKPIRLRDFVKAMGCYFSVVGYRNEEKVKCFLRYVPDEKGDRSLNGKKFRKLSHDEAVMHEAAKKYVDSGIFRLPHQVVEEVYKPEERLDFAMNAKEVEKIVEFFSEIPRDKMGVTGSRLIGLEGRESDVDFIVYGKWWFKAREKLRRGIEEGELSSCDEATWDFIFRKRRINLPYEIFVEHEERKYHRAFLGSTYFDLLYVRDYDELSREIPEEVGLKKGRLEVEGVVADDSFIFDYPAFYPLNNSEIHGVLSFTHTFIGQAFRGERILARGELEEINGKLFLVVGTKRETQDEFIVSLDLIERKGLMEEFRRWYREQEELPPLQPRSRRESL